MTDQPTMDLAVQAPRDMQEAPRSDAASLMAVISRAASDPNTDVVKLERLLDMFERIKAHDAKAAYTAALAAMQPDLPVIAERGGIKNKNDQVQSTYALWEDINEAIKPVLATHGFALSFRTGQEGDKIVVTGILSHRGGHSEATTMHLPIDTSGSKNAVQAVGSSTSYGKRYTAGALLNLTSRGEDDDGFTGGSSVINEEQRDTILGLVHKHEVDVEKFTKFLGVESIADIPTKKYRDAIEAINSHIQYRAKKAAK